MKLLNTVYQSGTTIQKKAAHVFLSTGLYHSSFFGPLYLFGQHKLPRTAELIKYALRITTLNGIYTGIKFRRDFSNFLRKEQKKFMTGYMIYVINYMTMSFAILNYCISILI